MRNENLSTILSIGHDTSVRGVGLSLEYALQRSRYSELRSKIDVADVIAALRDDPNLVAQWIMYSEDKRTDGGWYILEEKREIGRVSDHSTARVLETIEEAVAYYLLHELNYWADFDAT